MIISCNSFVKDKNLGNFFVLSEYDNIDRRILYTKDGNSNLGIEVVPMTVIEYANNSKWIIAKSSKSRFENNYEYWIIDKEFDKSKNVENIIKNIKPYMLGPIDSLTFIKKLAEQKIDLTFKKI